jgi:hypothetical protein
MGIAGKFLCSAFKAVDLFRGSGMRIFVLLAAAMSLAGCDALFGKPNVFKLPVDRAYQKLMAADVKPSGKGPFGRRQIETSGKRNESVEWTVKGSPFGPLCVASLKPQEAEKTRIDVSCTGSALNDGPAAGFYAKQFRNGLIELVDATLKDRPYDPKKAADGATAAFWPADVIDHGNLATAAAKALEMDRQVAEELRQVSSPGGSGRNSSRNR